MSCGLQGELPIDPRQTAMPGLGQIGDGLHRGKDSLNPFANSGDTIFNFAILPVWSS